MSVSYQGGRDYTRSGRFSAVLKGKCVERRESCGANIKGTSSGYVIFGCYGTDPARPKIVRNLPRDGYCMQFIDCSYITIRGFDVGVAGIGIWVNTVKAAQAAVLIDQALVKSAPEITIL